MTFQFFVNYLGNRGDMGNLIGNNLLASCYIQDANMITSGNDKIAFFENYRGTQEVIGNSR